MTTWKLKRKWRQPWKGRRLWIIWHEPIQKCPKAVDLSLSNLFPIYFQFIPQFFYSVVKPMLLTPSCTTNLSILIYRIISSIWIFQPALLYVGVPGPEGTCTIKNTGSSWNNSLKILLLYFQILGEAVVVLLLLYSSLKGGGEAAGNIHTGKGQ